MEKSINNFLLRDPREIDITRNLVITHNLLHTELRDLCAKTTELFAKHFGTHLLDQPREMARYSEHPEEFSPIKNFRMDVYTAIAMFYLEQLEKLDSLKKAS